MFAEAVDNLVTAAVALVLGLLMYFGVIAQWIYVIDNAANMAVSAVMLALACRGLWVLSGKYKHESLAGLVQ